MLKNQSLVLLVIFLFSFSFSACNSAVQKGDPGVDGTNGIDGIDGTSIIAGTGSYILTDANNAYLGYVVSLSDYNPNVYIITSLDYMLEINIYYAKVNDFAERSCYSTQDDGLGTVFVSKISDKDFGKRVAGINNKLYSYKNINNDGSASNSNSINGTIIESCYNGNTFTWINKNNGSIWSWDPSYSQENIIINDLNELKEVQPLDIGLPITIQVPLKLVRL